MKINAIINHLQQITVKGGSVVLLNIHDILSIVIYGVVFRLLCLILTLVAFNFMKLWLGITVCFICQYDWIEAKGGILAEKKSLSRFERWFGRFILFYTMSNSNSSIDWNSISFVKSTLLLIIIFQLCRSNQMK